MHHIRGVVLTEHSRRMAIQGTLDLEREPLERAGVASAGAFKEHTARFPGILPHQRTFARL